MAQCNCHCGCGAGADVPIISACELLTWVDGRNGSSFANLSYTGNMLTFAIKMWATGPMGLWPRRRNATVRSC